ncbi:MAG: hypothetical protein WDO12_06065 [Pseudomonadota bacterium]
MFSDQIYSDLEQIERVNQILNLQPTLLPGSRIVEKVLFLTPSRDLREIAAEHLDSLPASAEIAVADQWREKHRRRAAGELPAVRRGIHAAR